MATGGTEMDLKKVSQIPCEEELTKVAYSRTILEN